MSTNISSSSQITGSVTLPSNQEILISQSDDSILAYGYDGSTNRAIKTDSGGELQVDVLTSALPSGAATESTLGTLLTQWRSSSSSTSTLSRSATVQTALAANSSRKSFILWNEVNAPCYVKFGSGAAVGDFSFKIGNNGGYEVSGSIIYTGIITVIWATGGAGTLHITELT